MFFYLYAHPFVCLYVCMIYLWGPNEPEVNRKWIWSEPKVNRKWTESEPKVNRKWTEREPKVNQKWIESELKVNRKWTKSEQKVKQKWTESEQEWIGSEPEVNRKWNEKDQIIKSAPWSKKMYQINGQLHLIYTPRKWAEIFAGRAFLKRLKSFIIQIPRVYSKGIFKRHFFVCMTNCLYVRLLCMYMTIYGAQGNRKWARSEPEVEWNDHNIKSVIWSKKVLD